jgi:uncharacterized protein (TIGR02996 family)
MIHTDDPNLLAAVIANAENDAPRLVYADWLEENGDPHRADFIRVQCALAGKSPADPDYVDLAERKTEILAALWERRRPGPTLPEGIDFHDNWYEEADSASAGYHRGFPYFAQLRRSEPGMQLHHARQFRDALPQMMATTTLRGLYHPGLGESFVEILSAPSVAQVSALVVGNSPTHGDTVGTINAIAGSPSVHGLK